MANQVFAPTTASWTASGAGTGVAAVGIGTTMPTELANWAPYGGTAKPQSALVFWNPNFRTTLTYPSAKFAFICNIVRAGVQSDMFCGVGTCNNPSVSSVASILAGLNPFVISSGYAVNDPAFLYRLYGSRNQVLASILDADSIGNGVLEVANVPGQITTELLANGTVPPTYPFTGIAATFTDAGVQNGQIPT